MYINWQKYLNKLVSQKDKDIIKVITGIHRCGKSVLLFNIYYDYLINYGIAKDKRRESLSTLLIVAHYN